MQMTQSHMPRSIRFPYKKSALLPLILTVLFLFFPAPVQTGVQAGLSLCVRALIPAVFPFLCIAPMTADAISALSGGNSRRAALRSSFLVGVFCGFPMGAVTLAAHVRSGRLSPEDANRFAAAVSAPSPSFLIGYVGLQLFGDFKVGVKLLLISLCVQTALFLFLLKTVPRNMPSAAIRSDMQKAPALSDAVVRGAHTMLSVCAAVVFFSVIRTLIDTLAGAVLPLTGTSILGGIAEMTGGLSAVSDLWKNGILPAPSAMLLSAFLIGSGGCSVLMQVFSVLPEDRAAGAVPYQYIAEKTVTACLSGLLAYIAFSF